MVGRYFGVDHATVGLMRAFRSTTCSRKYSTSNAATFTAYIVDKRVVLTVQSDLIDCITRAGGPLGA